MKHCNECGLDTWESGDPYEGIGMPVPLGGQRHKSNCSVVPQMSSEDRKKLLDKLAEMDHIRRRGAAEAANFWIGA